jgi:HEAT repeat protein
MRILLFLLAIVAVAEPFDYDQLDRLLAESANFEPGAQSNAVRDIDRMVATIADSAIREAVEGKLLAALPKAQTKAAKAHLCRQLYYVGGSASIEPLAALLTDAEIADVVRRSLAVIPGSGDAMLTALPKVDAQGQIGLIIALGDQGHEAARPSLEVVLSSTNSAKSAAAASALGQLGGTKAVKALQAARPAAKGAAARAIDAALLRCAESLEPDAAHPVFEAFFKDDQPSHLRVAGLTGLARIADDPGALLTDAIKGEDAALASHAIRVVAETEGAVGPLLELLPKLEPATQALLIRALGARGETTLSAAVAPFAESEEAAPRFAAIDALGAIGDAGALQVLLRIAVTAKGDERNRARASLESLPVADTVLIRAMDSSNTASQEELIRTLAARRSGEAASKIIVVAATSDDDGLRREALRGLRKLVTPAHLARLFEHVAEPKAEGDVAAWISIIDGAVKDLPTPQAQAKPILAALITASPDTQGLLLPLLAGPATPAALITVRESLKNEHDAVRVGAVRALSKWPNADVAEDLLTIITGAEDETHRSLATRGYLDLARRQADSEGMYSKALDFAKKPDDRKRVLAGLASVKSLAAFKLVAGELDSEDVAQEAALAAIQIAESVADPDGSTLRPVLQRLADSADKAIVKRARAISLRYEEFDDFILTWESVGPFTADSYKKACATTFDYAETDWKPVTRGMNRGMLNCEQAFGGGSARTVYLRGSVTMAEAGKGQLELGSDDGVQVWLNGELVHEYLGNRGASRASDKVPITLTAGENSILAKVINDGGAWAFCCRIRDPEGASLQGLTLD